MGVIRRVAKYTNEELNRIQEQFAELVEGTELAAHEGELDEDVRAEDETQEEDDQTPN